MYTWNKSLLLVVAIFGSHCICASQPIKQLIVWDKDFNAVSLISEKETLRDLNALWKGKKVVKPKSVPNWKYKIDFYSSTEASRWHYDPSGYAMKLTKTKTSIFVIPSPERFKSLLNVN
jgi:hypothetical protein